MKIKVLLILSFAFSAACNAQTKGYVNLKTKAFYLQSNIRLDHKFFGYAKPVLSSQKLILFSVFTNDVKDNPHKCSLGAYYETSGLPQGDNIEYMSSGKKFCKMKYVTMSGAETIFYFEKRHLRFE